MRRTEATSLVFRIASKITVLVYGAVSRHRLQNFAAKPVIVV
jgi:hypothetical protein